MKFLLLGLLLTLSFPIYGQTQPYQVSDTHIQIINVQPKYHTVQQRQCRQEQVATNNSGTGAVLGAIAGGIIGNQVGKGKGNDAATAAGAVVGAMAGSRIGQDQHNVEVREVCNNVPVTMLTGEIVTFMYKGKRYSFETTQ